MVTHDPVAAGYADRVVFLADGRIVDRIDDPTPESVLDRLKSIGAEPAGEATSKHSELIRRAQRGADRTSSSGQTVAFDSPGASHVEAHPAKPVRRTSAGSSARRWPSASASPSWPGPSSSATRWRRTSTACSPRRSARPTPSSATPTRSVGDVGDGPSPRPRDVIDRIDDVDGVADSAVQIDGLGQLNDSDGEKIGGFGPPTIACRLDRRSRSTRGTWPRATPPRA